MATGSHLPAKQGGSRRNWPCQHLDLGVPAYRTMKKYFSIVWATQSVSFCYGSLRKLKDQVVPHCGGDTHVAQKRSLQRRFADFLACITYGTFLQSLASLILGSIATLSQWYPAKSILVINPLPFRKHHTSSYLEFRLTERWYLILLITFFLEVPFQWRKLL